MVSPLDRNHVVNSHVRHLATSWFAETFHWCLYVWFSLWRNLHASTPNAETIRWPIFRTIRTTNFGPGKLNYNPNSRLMSNHRIKRTGIYRGVICWLLRTSGATYSAVPTKVQLFSSENMPGQYICSSQINEYISSLLIFENAINLWEWYPIIEQWYSPPGKKSKHGIVVEMCTADSITA